MRLGMLMEFVPHRKEMLPWDVLPDADVIAIQETKGRPDQVPPEVAQPEVIILSGFRRKNLVIPGVAFFSKNEPDGVLEGVGDEQFDNEGRADYRFWSSGNRWCLFPPIRKKKASALIISWVFVPRWKAPAAST